MKIAAFVFGRPDSAVVFEDSAVAENSSIDVSSLLRDADERHRHNYTVQSVAHCVTQGESHCRTSLAPASRNAQAKEPGRTVGGGETGLINLVAETAQKIGAAAGDASLVSLETS
jgi:hypothetical protein